MSSYILSASHFNAVEYSIKEHINRPNAPISRRLFGRHTIKDFIPELRKLNVICYYLQYRRHYENIDAHIETSMQDVFRKTRVKYLNLHQLHAALCCIRYQIEPQHLEELRDLSDLESWALETLEKLINCIANYLVTEDDKYPAVWEIVQE